MPEIDDKTGVNMNAVIYATDLSVCSENVGPYAAYLAKAFQSKLIVAHAFTLSQAAMEVEFGSNHKRLSRQRETLQDLLSQEAASLASDLTQAIPVLVEGNPERVLPELADVYAPSLIVLGTHGGGRVERDVIGSVAEKILRSTSWPSLTVGPQVRAASSLTLPFQRILYATDFAPAAAHAATFAVSFAAMFGAHLDVLNVIHGDAVDNPKKLSEIVRHFTETLSGLLPRQVSALCNPETYVEVGTAHDRILQHISEHSIDLLVLGIRKTSHVRLEMLMSGAFRIIADANCPVLTVTGPLG